MSRSKLRLAGLFLFFMAPFAAKAADYSTYSISHERMQAIYDEVKTPFKYGVVLEPPAGKKVACPNVFRYGAKWYMVYVRIMFYFGAFWKPGAFDTFAASRDLVHWTKWDGEHLIKSSEPYDTPFAHKPWIIKQDGVVYHFYCAVGGKAQHRAIALATSKDLKKRREATSNSFKAQVSDRSGLGPPGLSRW